MTLHMQNDNSNGCTTRRGGRQPAANAAYVGGTEFDVVDGNVASVSIDMLDTSLDDDVSASGEYRHSRQSG